MEGEEVDIPDSADEEPGERMAERLDTMDVSDEPFSPDLGALWSAVLAHLPLEGVGCAACASASCCARQARRARSDACWARSDACWARISWSAAFASARLRFTQ